MPTQTSNESRYLVSYCQLKRDAKDTKLVTMFHNWAMCQYLIGATSHSYVHILTLFYYLQHIYLTITSFPFFAIKFMFFYTDFLSIDSEVRRGRCYTKSCLETNAVHLKVLIGF